MTDDYVAAIAAAKPSVTEESPRPSAADVDLFVARLLVAPESA